MGYIKKQLVKEGLNIILNELNFKYSEGYCDVWTGYRRTFYEGENSLDIIVNIEQNIIYFHKSDNLGDMIWNYETEIPYDILTSKEKFINWIDSIGD